MRLTLDQFLNKIGVDVVIRPYETIPYDYFNAEKGMNVMAEVSLSGDGAMINVEIQQIENGPGDKHVFTQVLQLQLQKEVSGQYMANSLRWHGQQLAGKRRNWFEGSCRLIKQALALLKKGTLPDFEALYKTTLDENADAGGAGGGGGGRSLRGDKLPPKPGQASGKF